MAKASAKKARKKKTRKTQQPARYKASAKELLKYYREMLLIRRFEEKASQLYGQGEIGGFCHLYIGQEAVVVGVNDCLEKGDSTITAYRDHGHALITGIEPEVVMAELMGRSGGISKGKGGSMHMFSIENGFFGGHGIVGTPAPLGTGLAFAHKYKDTGKIVTCYFGEGAANQGQVYEAFNMADLWQLPILYIIENNKYAMGTSVDRSTRAKDFYRRGEVFSIPGAQVDGMDVLAVRAAAGKAVEHVRKGKGPYLIEMLTYRYRGHSMSDPALYRSKDEVKKMKAENDPIDKLRRLLLDGKKASEKDLKTIDGEVKKAVTKAIEFARDSEEPGADELYKDVYVEEVSGAIR